MRVLAILVLSLSMLMPAAALAQRDTGGLPQQMQRNMESAMTTLQNQGLMTNHEALAESVGAEALDSFLRGAVAKLTFYPDGSYAAFARQGGELLSFQLGKQTVTNSGSAVDADDWLKTTGSFQQPKKKGADLSLKLSAGGRSVDVDCFNKYLISDKPVTFYVGPLNGLFCLGMADEEEVAG